MIDVKMNIITHVDKTLKHWDINISNVKKDEVERGDVLAAPDSLEESRMIDVKMNIITHVDKTLKHWDRLRLYHGTREILCRAVPLDKEEIAPGESGFVQLRLEESIVSKKGDTFVVRSYSPMATIGGGVIIDASPKKHKRFRLRLYHGTREILCRAVPLDKEEIAPGESGFVQLRLEESIVSKKGDTLVVRSYSPMATIGGGVIIDASPKKHKRFDEDVIETLKVKEKGELHDILEEYLKHNSKNYPTVKDMMSYSGAHEEDIRKALDKLSEEGKIFVIGSMYIHINHYKKLSEKVNELLADYHKHNRLKPGILKEELKSKVESKFKPKEFDIVLASLEGDGLIKIAGNIVSLKDFEVVFNEKQKENRNRMQKMLKKCGFESVPTIEEITGKDVRAKEVLDAMIGDSVAMLGDGYIMDMETYDKAKKMLVDYINEHGEITLGEYRDLIGSSRKNCMIILESFDRNRI